MPVRLPIRFPGLLLAAASSALPAVAEVPPAGGAPSLPAAVALQAGDGLELRYRPLAPADPTAAGGRLEGIAAGRHWALRSSVLLAAGPEQRWARLDTGFQLDAAGPLETLMLGDVLASGGGWSRPVRLGGLRFGRGLVLRPGFDPAAAPGATASAALPASPLGFGGSWAGAQPPSWPSLQAPAARLPAVSGPGLLAPGASDHEVAIGRLRTGWGTAEDRYGEAYAAAGWRRGLGAGLTSELRGEWTPSRIAAGLELVRGVQGLGLVDAMLARSQTDQASGLRWGLGLGRQAGAAAWRLSWDGFERGYTLVAAGSGEPDPRGRLRAELHATLTRRLDAALTLARSSWWDTASGQSVGFSLDWALTGGSRVSLRLSDQAGAASGYSSRVVWSLPLGG